MTVEPVEEVNTIEKLIEKLNEVWGFVKKSPGVLVSLFLFCLYFYFQFSSPFVFTFLFPSFSLYPTYIDIFSLAEEDVVKTVLS